MYFRLYDYDMNVSEHNTFWALGPHNVADEKS